MTVNLIKNYKNCFSNKYFVWSSVFGFVFLVISLTITSAAIMLATEKQNNTVTDIILSNIPAYNLANFFVYGAFALVIFTLFIVLIKPERFPFVSKSISVFYLTRSLFMNLTHLAPYPDIVSTNANILNKLTIGGDLFFSGHTGFPFLLALIFWQEKKLRYLFLILSVFFGTISLLGHYHYTIDVLSAFFIAYGVYHFCAKIFKKDHKILLNGVQN
ncbi:MAG: phosphatase PAP2-related protein [Candidatus Staskawiczbacteria bacterium]|nr:phosphatase PAP2-related protein [Candidatus Staskawiczbacteria bacterium]